MLSVSPFILVLPSSICDISLLWHGLAKFLTGRQKKSRPASKNRWVVVVSTVTPEQKIYCI